MNDKDEKLIHSGKSGGFEVLFPNLVLLAFIALFIFWGRPGVLAYLVIILLSGVFILLNSFTIKAYFYPSHIIFKYMYAPWRKNIRINKDEISDVKMLEPTRKSTSYLLVFYARNKKFVYADLSPEILEFLAKTYSNQQS